MTWKQALPAPEDIRFSSWPEETSPSAYTRSAKEELGFLRKLTRRASVYRDGSTSAPGISDLDFIVVLDDNDHTHQLQKWKALHRYLSPTTQYLTTHGPLIVNPALWHGLLDFKVLENLGHVSGPILPPPASTSRAPGNAYLLVQAEFHIFRPYRRFLREVLQRQVGVRPALSELQKMKVKAAVLRRFGIDPSNWRAFIDEVSQLRKDWFGLSQQRQIDLLYPLMIAGVEVDAEMIRETSTAMAAQGLSASILGPSDRPVVGAFDYTKIFVGDYDADHSLEYAVDAYQKSGELFFLLPANFMLPLLIYTSGAPTVRRYLEDRITVFGGSGDLNLRALPNEVVLPARTRLLETYFRFLEAQGLDKGLFFRRSEAPTKRAFSPRAFWHSAESHTKSLDNIPALVLRRQLEETRTQLQRLTEGSSPKLLFRLLIRSIRQVLAPTGSRRARVLGWPIRSILAQSWRLNFRR